MKKILFIAAILATLCVPGRRAQAQEPDAIYRLVKHEWTVNADGTSDYHYRHEVQILRNRALTAYADKGETFVVYNPDFETLTVNEVYTIQANGRRVEMPQNAFVYQLPSQCADCGRFNNLRELAMIHTGMEIGCTVVVDYTVHRNNTLLNQTLPIVKDSPIDRLEVNINLPSDHELGIQLYRGIEGINYGHLEEQQSKHSYRLVATNVIQSFHDAYLPANLYPTLRFYNGLVQWTPELDAETFTGAEVAMGQTMNKRSDIENVVAARDFIVDNIHLNDVAPELTAYTHATAAETWRSGCGTPTDKAVLLAAILRAEGFRASVAGDNADKVAVILDTMEYQLSLRSKAPITLYGEAKDEVIKVNTSRNPQCTMDTLTDGYYSLHFAAIDKAPKIDARRLALTRTTPVASTPCDIAVEDTYTLAKGVKMVGSKVSKKVEHEGIGSVEIKVKQSGNKIIVDRKLKLEQSLVPATDYAKYRELIATWQSIDHLLLKSK